MRKRIRRKELTEDDIPCSVMLLVLRVAYTRSSRGSEADMTLVPVCVVTSHCLSVWLCK
jgi:hypothetical protein